MDVIKLVFMSVVLIASMVNVWRIHEKDFSLVYWERHYPAVICFYFSCADHCFSVFTKITCSHILCGFVNLQY